MSFSFDSYADNSYNLDSSDLSLSNGSSFCSTQSSTFTPSTPSTSSTSTSFTSTPSYSPYTPSSYASVYGYNHFGAPPIDYSYTCNQPYTPAYTPPPFYPTTTNYVSPENFCKLSALQRKTVYESGSEELLFFLKRGDDHEKQGHTVLSAVMHLELQRRLPWPTDQESLDALHHNVQKVHKHCGIMEDFYK